MACHALTKAFTNVRKEMSPILVICFLGNALRNIGKNLFPVRFWNRREGEREKKIIKNILKLVALRANAIMFMYVELTVDLDFFHNQKALRKFLFVLNLLGWVEIHKQNRKVV